MDDKLPEQNERIINVSCDKCGGDMTYSPAQQALECGHCRHTRPLPREGDLVIEQSFTESLHLSDEAMGFLAETKVFHCNACGAETAVEPDAVRFTCPFCGSENVNEEAHEAKVIRPAGILPFKVPKNKALEKFKTWISKGFFTPSKLAKLAKLDGLKSVYIPFWTYDSDTQSYWTADAGYHYYETQSYTDSSGNSKTRQVRKTRWVGADGYYEHHFDDVLVVGSHGLPQNLVEKIYPFDLEEVVNYDSRYILGHGSEVYQKDVKEGFEVADGIMDAFIRGQVVKRIPGDTYRNLRINTHKNGITFKHILLPLWIAAYNYNGKVYRFLVNGQTGKISGKKPVAVWKIVALVAGVIGLGVALWLLFR